MCNIIFEGAFTKTFIVIEIKIAQDSILCRDTISFVTKPTTSNTLKRYHNHSKRPCSKYHHLSLKSKNMPNFCKDELNSDQRFQVNLEEQNIFHLKSFGLMIKQWSRISKVKVLYNKRIGTGESRMTSDLAR